MSKTTLKLFWRWCFVLIFLFTSISPIPVQATPPVKTAIPASQAAPRGSVQSVGFSESVNERVSLSSPGWLAVVNNPGISPDGTRIVFSARCNLLPGCTLDDSETAWQYFVYNALTGELKRLSISLYDGHQWRANGPYVVVPSFSADGKRTVVNSCENGVVPEDINGQCDVFVMDLDTNQTWLASVSSDGGAGNDASWGGVLSSDGRYVLFQSVASNLVPNDNNQGFKVGMDVFLHDLMTGSTTRLSVSASGQEGNSNSWPTTPTPDMKWVLFDSLATNLTPQDANAAWSVLLRNQQNGAIELISITASGATASWDSHGVDISDDARYVLFNSPDPNLVSGDQNNCNAYGTCQDVFVRDRQNAKTLLVSSSWTGSPADGPSEGLWLSPNGQYAYFISRATNIVPDDTNGQADIFRRDLLNGRTERLPFVLPAMSTADEIPIAHLAENASSLIYLDSEGGAAGGLYLYDLQVGVPVTISLAQQGKPAQGSNPDLSADGRFVAFKGTVDYLDGVYLHDRITRETITASRNLAGNPVPGAEAALSGNGRYVAYQSESDQIVAGDTNNTSDIFVYDRINQTTTRVSVASNGAQANGASNFPDISADGRWVVFASGASNLISDDTNGRWDIFLHDQQTGVTRRIGLTVSGGQPDNDATRPTISDDGRYVAFLSNANLLPPWDASAFMQSFVFDTLTGGVELISSKSDGTASRIKADQRPVISGDGRYVVFASDAADLVSGDTNGQLDVFVRDRVANLTFRVSLSSEGSQGNAASGAAFGRDLAISSHGDFVVFTSYASNLDNALDGNGKADIFIHQLKTGITERLSWGADLSLTDNDSSGVAMAADGTLIAFGSAGTNLVASDHNNASDVFVTRWQAPAFFRFTGPLSDYFSGNEHLEWLAANIDPATSSVELSIMGSTSLRPIASHLPVDQALDWDTTAMDDGTYDLIARLNNEAGMIQGEVQRTILINNTLTWHGGDLSGNETWSAGTIHAVEDTLIIPSGLTLTIQPGAIVKFARGTGIVIQSGGTLNAPATSGSPIILTSLSDDSAGGDSNLDGSLAQPGAGDWKGISGSVSLNGYVDLRYAQLAHSGTLSTSETWKTGFIHLVNSTVSVPTGKTLTIQPGAVIKFASGQSLVVNAGGTLSAPGTLAQPILFTSIRDDQAAGDTNNDGDATLPNGGDWNEILVNGTATFNYATIRYTSPEFGLGALRTAQAGASVTFSNGLISDSLREGVMTYGAGSIVLSNSLIIHSDRAVNSDGSGLVRLINCTLDDNRVGIWGHSGRVEVHNSIISNSYEYGVWNRDGNPSSITLQYSDVWSLSGENYNISLSLSDLTGLFGNISADPRFKNSAQGNYRPDFLSPAIDSANSNLAPAADRTGQPRYDDPRTANSASPAGSFADMGAYEFIETASSNLNLTPTGISGPANAMAGGLSTLRWTVANTGADSISGPWHDALYLSGPQTVFIRHVLVGEGLTLLPGQSTSFTAQVQVPGATLGNYHWMVKTNAQGEVFEGQNLEDNSALSAASVFLDLPELPINGQVTYSSFSRTGQSLWFKFTPPGGQDISLFLDRAGTRGASELYLSCSAMPTREHYEARSTDWNALDVNVVIAAAPAQTCYALAYAASFQPANRIFAISAGTLDFGLAALSPARVSNTGPFTLKVTGGKLDPAYGYALVSPGGTAIPATAITPINGGTIFLTFNLAGKTTGQYTLRVTGESSQIRTLDAALEVVHLAAPPVLAVSINIPERVRIGRPFNGSITYQNAGLVDLPAPLFAVSASGAEFKHAQDTIYIPQLGLMGVSPEGNPAVLRPGQRGEVRFTARTTGAGAIEYTVGYKRATDSNPVDWAAFGAQVRPAGLDDATWNAVWAEFSIRAGSTWGGYVQWMGTYAAAAARQGEDPTSERGVLRFIIQDLLRQQDASLSGKLLLNAAGYPAPQSIITFSDHEQAYAAVSQADGTFYAALPAGTYSVQVDGFANPLPASITITDPGSPIVQDFSLQNGGKIAGLITNANGQALVNVLVTAKSGLNSGQTLTQNNGYYEITGLPDGTYTVSASGAGWGLQQRGGLALSHQAQLRDVTFRLEPANSLSGQVLNNANSVPIADATLVLTHQTRLYSPNSGTTWFMGTSPESSHLLTLATTTNASGQFQFSELPPGSMTLQVFKTGFSLHETTLELWDGQSLAQDFRLDAGASLTVAVQDSTTGLPLSGAMLSLWDGLRSQDINRSGLDGMVLLDNLPPADLTLQASRMNYWPASLELSFSAGQVASQTLALHPAGRASGTVMLNGQPQVNLLVQAINPAGDYQIAFTDETGLYDFTHLAEGSYTIALWGGQLSQVISISTSTWVFSDLNFALAGHRINGSLGNMPNGVVLLLQGGKFVTSATANENGHYIFSGIPDGSYQVLAGGAAGMSASSSITMAGSDLTVPELQPGALHLALSFKSTTGQPVPDVRVSLLPANPDTTAAAFALTGVSDAAGQITLIGIAPGAYTLIATHADLATARQAFNLTGNTDASLILSSGWTLSGRVTDGSLPLNGADVILYNAAHQVAGRLYTGMDGVYTMPGLSSGNYTLVISQPGFDSHTAALILNNASLMHDAALGTATVSLSGSVIDNGARRVAGVRVGIYNAIGEELAAAYSDYDGAFQVDGLPASSYTLRAQAFGFFSAELPGVAANASGLVVSLVPGGLGSQPLIAAVLADIREVTEVPYVPPDGSSNLYNAGADLYEYYRRQNPEPERLPGDEPGGPLLPQPEANCPAAYHAFRQAYAALLYKDSSWDAWKSAHLNYDTALSTSAAAVGLDLLALAGSIASLFIPASAAQDLVNTYPTIHAFTQVGQLSANLYSTYYSTLGLTSWSDTESLIRAVNSFIYSVDGATYNGYTLADLASQIRGNSFRANANAGLALGAIGALNQAIATYYDFVDAWRAMEAAASAIPIARGNYEDAWLHFWADRKAILDANAACKDPDEPQKQPPYDDGDKKKNQSGGSEDPNDKVTTGLGLMGNMERGDPILYTIHFENKAQAALPAQQVVVTDKLSGLLDWSTLELVSVGFNGIDLAVPSGQKNAVITATVSTDPYPVRTTITLNPDTGVLTWVMESIDGATGLWPDDPLSGFLPPNDSSHRGEGYVTFRIYPLEGLKDGTRITNQARIVFDVNPPIDTNVVTNTIGEFFNVYLPNVMAR